MSFETVIKVFIVTSIQIGNSNRGSLREALPGGSPLQQSTITGLNGNPHPLQLYKHVLSVLRQLVRLGPLGVASLTYLHVKQKSLNPKH